MKTPTDGTCVPCDQPFRLGDFDIDPNALRIESPDQRVKVEFKVMQVLLVLAADAGEVVSRQKLESTIWSGRIVTDDAVTNAVAKLRRAFGDNARSPRLIETVPKLGYRLMVQPQLRPSPEPDLPLGDRRRVGAGILAAVLLLSLVGAYLLNRPPPETRSAEPAVAARPTVAVLPFDNLIDAPDQAFFVDGISQDLIADLSLQPGFVVLAMKATYHLGTAGADLRQAVMDLGARYLVRGSVAKQDGEILLTVRLVDTESGRTLWSDTLRGPEDGIFAIQRAAASGLAEALGGPMRTDFEFVSRQGTTDTLAAYDEFLQGRAAYLRMTPDDNRLARTHYLRATELDPDFARAHAGVALTWAREVMDGWAPDPERSLREAARNVALAEAIDPDVPQIYFVKGLIALFRGQHLAAAEAAHKATGLDPNYADAYGLLAWILHYGGRPDVAIDALHEALRLNPLSSASFEEVAGEINFATGRYAEAVACFRNALERNPTHSRARLWLAASLAQTGQLDDARWELDELLTVNPDLSFEDTAFGFPHKDPELLSRFLSALGRVRLME